jgi:membrane AbrB-like protein
VKILSTLAVGAAGGWLALWLHVPAGALMGSMTAVAAMRLLGGPVATVPTPARRAVQMVLGMMLGLSVTLSSVLTGRLLLPAVILTVAIVILSVGVAYLIQRATGWSWPVALMCAAPAGITEISLLADDMGYDATLVAAFHLVRVVTIVTLVPWLVIWVR